MGKPLRKRRNSSSSLLRQLRPIALLSLLLLSLLLIARSMHIMASSNTAFSLLVTLTFVSRTQKEQFLKDIAPLADYVRDHEPDTIAYQVLQSDKEPLRVLILERYRNKEKAFLEVHRSSEAFKTFRPKLKAMEEAGLVSVAGESYVDTDVGFGDRVVAPPSSS